MSRASELASQLFGGVKDAVKAGLESAGAEIGAEVKRLGTQGAMELASALFNGHAFVPYGPGQYTPAPENAPEHETQQSHASVHGNEGEQPGQDRQREGMGR